MKLGIIVESGWVSIGLGSDERRRLEQKDIEHLETLAKNYRELLGKKDKQAQLLHLGRQLYDWLDGSMHWLQRLCETLLPPYELEIRGPLHPTATDWAVLQAPWELLADENGFWAENTRLGFSPVRRLGKAGTPSALSNRHVCRGNPAEAERQQAPALEEHLTIPTLVATGRRHKHHLCLRVADRPPCTAALYRGVGSCWRYRPYRQAGSAIISA